MRVDTEGVPEQNRADRVRDSSVFIKKLSNELRKNSEATIAKNLVGNKGGITEDLMSTLGINNISEDFKRRWEMTKFLK